MTVTVGDLKHLCGKLQLHLVDEEVSNLFSVVKGRSQTQTDSVSDHLSPKNVDDFLTSMLTGKLCRQPAEIPTSTQDGLPKSNKFNPVHSRKDAFLSSRALSTAGYSLLILKWYECGYDTNVYESRPYASSGISNKSDDGDKLANTTSTVCSLPLPHAYDVNKLDVESFLPPSGVRRDDSFYNTIFKTNVQIDAEGRPMMELLTRNKYADNHSSFFLPQHLAQWSPGFNHTVNANQQNISKAQYYRCPPEHRQLIKAHDFDPVFHQPLIHSLIQGKYYEPAPNITPQEILDREARFSRDRNPCAVRLSSQMCTIPTTPFDFCRSMTATHVPAVARQRPTTGSATRPGTAAPPRTPSASLLNASSRSQMVGRCYIGMNRAKVLENAKKSASASVLLQHPNLMVPKTRPRAASACNVLHGREKASLGEDDGGGVLEIEPWATHKVFDANASAFDSHKPRGQLEQVRQDTSLHSTEELAGKRAFSTRGQKSADGRPRARGNSLHPAAFRPDSPYDKHLAQIKAERPQQAAASPRDTGDMPKDKHFEFRLASARSNKTSLSQASAVSRTSRASHSSAPVPLEADVRSAGYQKDNEASEKTDAGAQGSSRGGDRRRLCVTQSETASQCSEARGFSAGRQGHVGGSMRVKIKTDNFEDLSRSELLELQRCIVSTLSSRVI